MDNPKELLSSMHYESIFRNEQSMYVWNKYKEDVKTTQELLKTLPKELNHQVLVPIGRKAFMPGKIVHTNEFLVSIGSGYFVKRTANQSADYCSRKIKDCDEMLGKLEKELQLFQNKISAASSDDAFGSDERPEIIEHVTEEEDKEWREQHRIREREYRQKLAETKANEKKIESEQDLWERLDQLELEEELEDELNRLHEGEDSDDEDENVEESVVETKTRKKSVGFCAEPEEIPEEPLRLVIKHSETPGVEISKSNEIVSPADIYEKYVRDIKNSQPVSILKVKENPNRSYEEAATKYEEDEVECPVPVVTGFELSDVIERTEISKPTVEPQPRRVSKFKASRMKK